MNSMHINTSLYQHIDAIKTNSEALLRNFPELHLAIESVSDLFDQLFVEQFQQNGEPWSSSVHKMIFASHSSWLQGIIMSSAGFNETGLICVRRAIEYVCYSAKINNSNEKNIIWLDRGLNKNSDKLFSSKFSIPTKYFTPKYSSLKALLVWHDFASTFGAHGNFSTIVGKWDSATRDRLRMSFHDNPEGIPLSTGVAVRIGSFIVKAYYEIFTLYLKDAATFKNNYDVSLDVINKARISVSKFSSHGNISLEEVTAINSNEDPLIEEMYQKLVEKYNV